MPKSEPSTRRKQAAAKPRRSKTGSKAAAKTTAKPVPKTAPEAEEAADFELKRLKVKPVGSRNWKDFEALFSARGGPSYCWCMLFRMDKDELKHNTAPCRKQYMQQRVEAKVQVGLLAYDGDTPVAWCSVAPRESFPIIGGQEDIEKVWSISCFYIHKAYRGKGLTAYLIEQAKKLARKHKARYLEAYPVEKGSPSYRFMGYVETFERAGFKYVKPQGKRRKVMSCAL